MKSAFLFAVFAAAAVLLALFDGIEGFAGIALALVYGLIAGGLSAILESAE